MKETVMLRGGPADGDFVEIDADSMCVLEGRKKPWWRWEVRVHRWVPGINMWDRDFYYRTTEHAPRFVSCRDGQMYGRTVAVFVTIDRVQNGTHECHPGAPEDWVRLCGS